jgi:hypothetical protein
MAIQNIIRKAEQEFPPAIKQELDPLATQLSGYVDENFYLKSNPSGFITSENVVFTTGDQTISGDKTFAAKIYVFSGANVIFVDNTGIVSGDWQFINNTNFSGTLNFNTANTGEVLDGQMNWNKDYGTLQIGMDNGNVINPIGFKSFYRVKAASTIRKGKVVMALGGVGNSEYILAREAQNIGNSGQLIMGVSAEEITTNNYGDVVAFGAVRGINTNDYPVDSILYYDTASTGEFTNIPPEAPNPKVIVALNTTSANNGIVFVRVGSDTSNFYTNDNPSGFITNEDVVFTTGTQTISGNKTFQANQYNFDGANISIYGGGSFEVNASVETKGIPKDLGGVSGIQVMTTGAYNSGIPLSGVVYILI